MSGSPRSENLGLLRVVPTMKPTVQVLEPGLVERIVDEALDVLQNRGVEVESPSAQERLTEAGLPVDGSGRVKFPRAIVEEALQSAPSSIALFDREGDPFTELEQDRVHFAPASSALRIMDRRTGEVRDPKTDDFVEYVKVADGLAHLSYLSTAFIPKDVPADIADAWRLYLVMKYSKKPVVSGAFTDIGVPRMARIMTMFRGDETSVREKPMSIFTCCPNTPLRWGNDPVHNIFDCAEWGIPIEVVPVLLLGMISPSTTVGALVLHTAEVLSGLTIAQRAKPGSPVLFGGAPASMHMRWMTNPMTAVEALQVYCGYAQIAKHLNLPCQAYMALSDSKFNDAQAGFETGVGAFLAASAGFNSVSGPGMLDYVNCFSLEKLALDDEIVAQAQHFVRPVGIKDDLPTMPLIDELLAENHLLAADHTQQYWPEELYLPGPAVDRTNWQQWEEQGSRNCKDRSLELVEEALSRYESDPIDPAIDREARDLLSKTCKEPGAELPEVDS